MKWAEKTRTLACILIAAGILIAALSLYADAAGLGSDDDYLGPIQWLGAGLGFLLTLSGVALVNKDRIRAGSGALLHQARARLAVSWPLLLAVLLTFLVAASALYLRLHNITAALPYPGHVDEPHISERAGDILKTGSLDLQFFNYPHTPIYLATGGLLAGYADAAMHLEVNNTQAIGSLGFPYFDKPRVIWAAKALFAALSVAAMVFMGVVGMRAYGHHSLLWLAPLVILFSTTYFYYSHKYLNVDLAGAFFVAAVYFFLFQSLEKDTVFHKSIAPGGLGALVLTSKYNLLWIVVPPLLVILLYSQKNRIGKILLYLLSLAVGFLILMPDVITNLTLFVDTIAGSMFHYARGHTGSEGEPGPLQLIYYLNRIVDAYALPTLFLAALGIAAAFYKNWKGTLVIISFPAILLLYMSAQRTRFERNIVSVHLFYGLFVAVGILFAYELANRLLERYTPLGGSSRLRHIFLVLAFVILLGIALPVQRPVAWARTPSDSRNLATAWIQENLAEGSTLLIPRELGMDTRPLEEDYQITEERFATLTQEGLSGQAQALGDPHILMPVFADGNSTPSGQAAAGELNRFADKMRFLVEFPGSKVLLNQHRPVSQGNPAISIGLLELPQQRLESVGDRVEIDLSAFAGRKRITQEGDLRLPWNSELRSPPILLTEGRYEVALVTKGTEAKGANALFRVQFGDERQIGEFYSQEAFQETRLDLEIAQDTEASLIVSFVNDTAEKDDAGEIVADRNAWIQSVAIFKVDGQR